MSALRRFQPLGIRFSGLVLTTWHWEQVQTTGVLTVVVVDTLNIQRRRSVPVLERPIRRSPVGLGFSGQWRTEKLSPVSYLGSPCVHGVPLTGCLVNTFRS